ncbi:MAG: methylated-DNA--[protein]-cysteine S-methyltransferase [Phenylobacterium sp.]|uniref:Methylated-DNA--protein-cysteine methyltransferase n=1 Tax=Phenylobacterium ferrooxidans TaxID=2982689 RepID=A0ABW6CN04_9CAUL|nr:methylated-DNA--[protein]-cysteine S-methyltransferase [Phenylobacterium sp.]MDO8323310.1 methylated-DNA--[protein]-cysteine S-methyltransferase [Phenylobacterium sp.]MDO8911010.1 methylated-DNA--[protein]-cysteine S-methyltransferase [Phenylobacterium sp.]MDO9246940.1 methylated-DNA--[protein]-cysteine S-methyltransferase [Phenylobacterium sp.]MDP2009906.1 methylated-DNA--[protein]-cysteine S-methyltransferase [Phenylobacterium sp.]MDP3099960.1 methylated-DNA--[protein]-cysteine S-methyltr
MTKSLPETLILDRVETPVGEALVVVDEAGVLRAFDFADYEARMLRLMGRHYPGMALTPGRAPEPIRAAVTRYFAGDLSAFDGIAWATNGTAFQRKVWEALCTIPAGETLSYKGLAERIGSPSAMRAVGLANGSNPVAIVVPCHRVIGANGGLTGYGGGLPRKRWLLSHEGATFKDAVAA